MPIEDVLRSNLTPPQQAAATDDTDEVLTLACAGSGKSRTLAFRIARLLAQGEDPTSIVAFTFTEKAAESIKLQVAKALSAAGLEPTVLGAMYIGTIHSYCQGVLSEMDARYRQFDVLDDNRLALYLISRYPALGLQRLRGRARRRSYFDLIRQVSNAWKTMNDEMVRIEDVSAYDAELGSVLQGLSDRLNEDEFIDFSLMIRLVVEALQRGEADTREAVNSLKHLMVDEYQDVNPAQEQLVSELHKLSSTLFVVGDDDQAIYSWRGADVSNIISFGDKYPQCSEHTLSWNFRSTSAIVSTADRFAAAELGAMRIDKYPDALDPDGPRDFRNLWFDTRVDEAEWVVERINALLGTRYEERDGTVRGLTPGDFAILMRSTRQPEQNDSPRHAAFTEALETQGIAYSLEAGGGVFDRPHVSALRATFALLRDGSPSRSTAERHFNDVVLPTFPLADFDLFTQVLADWGRLIHAPITGTRRRVYPQQLVHDLLNAFRIDASSFDDGIMRDLGVFSRMIQDVEAVYLSVDTAQRFREILNFLQHVAENGYDTSTDDVLQRPDAVTVSTVHRVKGLEFPVVFVVDVEARRFPKDRRRYEGWLPREVIQSAINRGAYQSTPEEEARLFYTALTRGERYLHVSGSASVPGGNSIRRPSQFSQRLTHPEISTVSDTLPAGLTPHAPESRVDEAIVPTSYSDIRYYLRCPQDYKFRKSFGFSPPIPPLFGFGMTVHTAVAKLHEVYADGAPSGDDAEQIARSVFHLKHVPQSQNPEDRPGAYENARESAAGIVKTYAEEYAEDFTRQRQVEVRFEIPVDQAVISGSIDLLLKEDAEGNILEANVVDFKAMEGGVDPETNEELYWTELALQVQLYAKAAREVLGENARTGSVHLLKDNKRIEVPVTDEAVEAAVRNVEWAVGRVLAGDFPMRPHEAKCSTCDFQLLCPQEPEEFQTDTLPFSIHIPGPSRSQLPRAFSEFD